MERQIAEQKRLLAEAQRKPPSEADLIQKIRRELAAEAAARNPGSSQRNVPGNPLQLFSTIQSFFPSAGTVIQLFLVIVCLPTVTLTFEKIET